MKQIRNLVDGAQKEELLFLQKIIDSGELEQLISKKLIEISEAEKKICPVCGTSLNPRTSIKLEYGPDWLRKRAYFDAVDCVEYFIKDNLRTKQ